MDKELNELRATKEQNVPRETKKEIETIKVNGAETIIVETETYKIVEMGKEKKKQKVSVSYTLKSYANNIKKLEEAKLITREEGDTLRHVYKKMVDRWVSIEMTI